MSRLIDADALKNYIKLFDIGCGCYEDYQKSFLNAIDAQPTIEPEQRWRPYSEPPEEDGVYIVYAPGYSGGSSSAKECHDGVMFSKYKNGKWSIEHGYYSRPNCVKAWKPLDKPLRGEKHETCGC